MRTQTTLAVLGLAISAIAIIPPKKGTRPDPTQQTQRGEEQFTIDFGLEFASPLLFHGGNRYLDLTPGNYFRFEGYEDGEFVEVLVSVRGSVKPIRYELNGFWKTAFARVVEEREWIDGELAEVTLNYYGRCPESDNIYYLGEYVEHYENGFVIDNEGSWLAGVDGAQPGLLIPSFFLLGARYCQEMAPGVSMDRGENVAMGVTYVTPAGTFENCIIIEESTPLEPDEITLNVYAPGIGPVADGPLKLVEYQLN